MDKKQCDNGKPFWQDVSFSILPFTSSEWNLPFFHFHLLNKNGTFYYVTSVWLFRKNKPGNMFREQTLEHIWNPENRHKLASSRKFYHSGNGNGRTDALSQAENGTKMVNNKQLISDGRLKGWKVERFTDICAGRCPGIGLGIFFNRFFRFFRFGKYT